MTLKKPYFMVYNSQSTELVRTCITYLTNYSDTIKNAGFCPDTNPDTRIGAAL